MCVLYLIIKKRTFIKLWKMFEDLYNYMYIEKLLTITYLYTKTESANHEHIYSLTLI